MKKGLLAAIAFGFLAVGLAGCAPKEEDMIKWAEDNGYVKNPEENGYVKAEDYNIDKEYDASTSATAVGQGGVKMGSIAWTDSLVKKVALEYVKGFEVIDDQPSYREMYQIAVCANNQPVVSSVEYWMANTDTFELFGSSEANTAKLNAMRSNPHCSVQWTRQLRAEDVASFPGTTYFGSYGLTMECDVVFYDWANLTGTKLTEALAKVRGYMKSMASAQFAMFFNPEAPNYLNDEALKAYLVNGNGSGYYSLVPTSLTITCPWMLPQYDTQYARSFISDALEAEMLSYVQSKDSSLSGLMQIKSFSPLEIVGLYTQATVSFAK